MNDKDVVVTKWPTDEEEAELVYVERVQTVTDQSESNDNSVSVYVDANSSQCTPEIWNENITLATNSITSGQSSVSESRKRSSTPDSTTEIPDDDEDNEEEGMFLSIGSDMELQRTSLTAIVAARWASKEANNGANLQNDAKEMVLQESQSSDDDVKSWEAENKRDCEADSVKSGESQSAEANRGGKVDLKNVKSKVGSWATSSPTKTANQNKSSPVHLRRPAAAITPAANAKLQRPPLSPMKVAILRPLKGKPRPAPNLNQNQRTRSTSVSSLGSEEAVTVETRNKDGAKGEEAVAKDKKVSTKLGTTTAATASTNSSATNRPQARGNKPQQSSPGPRQAQNDGSSLGQSGHNQSGSPTKQRQSQGIPKPRFSADRSLGSSITAKTSTNQQPAPPTRLAPPVTAASKLPVKGLPTSLSSSSLGSNANENNGGKAAAAPAPGASESDERPNRSALPVGSQSTARPPGSSDASKASPMRNRAVSLQNRPTNTGLKAPSVSNSSSSKPGPVSGSRTPPSAAQSPTKHNSQNALQRSGSTRLSRVNSAVDKTKREAQSRGSNVSGDRGAGHGQQQQQNNSSSGGDAVPDVLNSNSSAAPRAPDTTSSAPSPSLSKPRTSVSRSSPKTASRLQPGAPRTAPSSAPAPVEEVKQAKEQVEKKNQAVVQLKKLLLQGNRRVEALALVIQHLFNEVEELRSRQEAETKKQEETHSQNVESLKQQHEATLQELKTTQQTELENLQKTLKETEDSLTEKVVELTEQRDALSEKLNAEEEKRKRILNDKSLKDSHTLYLEQELESLKVVLEIKNNQLHQKDKKLMDLDKLVESNIKLEECLTKVQQENEDYRARMDRHAALSKQLSSEQAILQQTLQKESKVNKRLSMENEELLWKLHNGDLLSSPRRLSPTSPFGSPRNSAAFPTAAPLSPR
ncbi:hypothetical protein WMY93_006181 [Mugilogobius chulae]|uniref:Microtubule-associated tumor suppressor 1 n=1 Tax=Mugilogobius chulae TaxID=88201 RepID=A0AAW0PVH8_9GOBI